MARDSVKGDEAGQFEVKRRINSMRAINGLVDGMAAVVDARSFQIDRPFPEGVQSANKKTTIKIQVCG